MLDVLWKVVEALIDTRIKTVVQFHDVLHGFCAGRGTGTTITELKISQELVSVDQDLLFLALLYLSKAYDNLDQGKLLQTLAGYGAGPKMQGLLTEFCSC